MAKGLQQQDFSNPQVWQLVQKGKYDLALLNHQQQDLKPILVNWLSKNAPNINVENEQIVDLITNWYLYFKSLSDKNNPLFAFLKFTNRLGVKPTYNDLVAVNNKYEEHILDDVDFQPNSMCEVLSNKDFYKKPMNSQNYWLDIYAFFSDYNNVKKVVDYLPKKSSIKIGNDEFNTENLSYGSNFIDALLFEGGNPNGKLRHPRTIENTLNMLSSRVPNELLRKKNSYKDVDKLKDFILRNEDSLSDETLVGDLRLLLNEE